MICSKVKKIILFAVFVFVIALYLSVNVFAYSYGYYYYDDYDYDEYYTDYEPENKETNVFDIEKTLLISIAVGVAIALIITGVMRSKMKTVRFVNTAGNYIKHGSMNITRRHDIYLYSTVTKIPKPQNNKRK